MTYIDRAPKYQLAQVLAQNLAYDDSKKPEYKDKTLEQLYFLNYNRLMRKNREELYKKLKEKKQIKQLSRLEMDVERLNSLIEDTNRKSSKQLILIP